MKPLLALLIFVMLAAPAWAQDLDKGKAAFDRGNYAAALREWRTLAEQGNSGHMPAVASHTIERYRAQRCNPLTKSVCMVERCTPYSYARWYRKQ